MCDSKLQTSELYSLAQLDKGSWSSELGSQMRLDVILGTAFSYVSFAKEMANKPVPKESTP